MYATRALAAVAAAGVSQQPASQRAGSNKTPT